MALLDHVQASSQALLDQYHAARVDLAQARAEREKAQAAAAKRSQAETDARNRLATAEQNQQKTHEELQKRIQGLQGEITALASEDAGHDFATFPRPIPHLTSEDVLVMTRVPGVRYTDALAAYPDSVDGERLLRLDISPGHGILHFRHEQLQHLRARFPAVRVDGDDVFGDVGRIGVFVQFRATGARSIQST